MAPWTQKNSFGSCAAMKASFAIHDVTASVVRGYVRIEQDKSLAPIGCVLKTRRIAFLWDAFSGEYPRHRVLH
jgi:hypothetical protein